MKLTREELARYSRHITLPEVGIAGQEKLKEASVLLVGAGGLGAPVAMYLTAAGIGRIGLVDFDTVDASNLQRQVLFDTEDVGTLKLEAAADRLRRLNPHVHFELHARALSRDNALDLIGQYDIIIDGTDNFATRYLVNDACVLTGKPNVYGSIFQFEGQVSVFGMQGGPCYRCIYPEPPPPGLVPSCAEGGVLGVLPGMVGTMQATEAIKLVLGIGEPLIGRLVLIDALSMRMRELNVPRDPDCPLCGENPVQTTLIDYEAFCGTAVHGQMYKGQMYQDAVPEMTVHEFQGRGSVRPVLLDVRPSHEADIADIGADRLIPLNELPDRLEELEAYRDEELVVHCRSGTRSAQAVRILREAGFGRALNLKGGTLAWSDEIDPGVPKY